MPSAMRPIENFPSWPRLLWRGLTRRCAWCGDRRAYFVGWFTRQPRCRACGHPYRRGDEAFELGAFTANMILTFLCVLAAILIGVVATGPEIDVIVVAGAAAAVALVGPALFYPVSFTLWQAIDLTMQPPTPGELRGDDTAP